MVKPIAGIERKKTTKKTDIREVFIEGNHCHAINLAASVIEEADAIKETSGKIVKDMAAIEILNGRLAGDPACSVKMTDGLGETVMVTIQSKGPNLSEAQVEEFARIIGDDGSKKCPKVDTYLVEKVVTTFDASVFTDEDGNHRAEVFAAFQSAIRATAMAFGLTESPLKCESVTTFRPTWEEVKYRDLKPEQLVAIGKIAPNVTTIKPLSKKPTSLIKPRDVEDKGDVIESTLSWTRVAK